MVCSICSVDVVLDGIVARELSSGRFPQDVVEYAARAVRANVSARGEGGERLERRVEAYFAAVARRRVVRSCGGTAAAARVIADSVIADLMKSGRDRGAVVDELRRGWAGQLPAEVIDECLERLCA